MYVCTAVLGTRVGFDGTEFPLHTLCRAVDIQLAGLPCSALTSMDEHEGCRHLQIGVVAVTNAVVTDMLTASEVALLTTLKSP